MDETGFGLRQRPFRAIPDTAFYYPATASERVLARLQEAIQDDEGLVLLTGEPGTGKTLVCHCLIERLGPEVTCIFLTNSHFRDRLALLQAIHFDLSLPYEGRTEQELRLALTEMLLKNCQAGRRTLLLVDEAQHLHVDVLEELRLLGNLEAQQSKAFQVLLAGQPGLLDTLRRPGLAAFNQRLAVRARLEPMDLHEAADYLVHRLRTAGGRPENIFTDEALEVLARATRGLPRRLNQAAQHALAIAQDCAAGPVDVEVALEALAAVGLEANTVDDQRDSAGPLAEEMLYRAPAHAAGKDGAERASEDDNLELSQPDETDESGASGPSPLQRLFTPPRRSA
jgi:type II secretory pathway predicted ATPase ExeA